MTTCPRCWHVGEPINNSDNDNANIWFELCKNCGHLQMSPHWEQLQENRLDYSVAASAVLTLVENWMNKIQERETNELATRAT